MDNSIRDKLILEFMKNTPHKHNFMFDNCELCEINITDCKHDKSNITEEGLGNEKISCLCSCGKNWEIICFHDEKYIDRHSSGEYFEDIYHCSRCDTTIDA